MAQFIVVKEVPDKLGANEMVIYAPNFVQEILETKGKPVGRNLTSHNYLRNIMITIGLRYDKNDEFNPIAIFPYNRFVGLAYKDEEDLNNKVIVPMMAKYYPKMFYKYADTKVKERPLNVTTIYFVDDGGVGSTSARQAFLDNGISQESLKVVKNTTKNVKKDSSDKAE